MFEMNQKYDPDYIIHQGRLFASKGYVEKGVANVFVGNMTS